MSYQPQYMLVTGGAGFIGSNFIRHVLAHYPDIHLINLDKLTYAGSLDHIKDITDHERHHFICGDIGDAKLVRHVLQHHHIDTIVHFAAESHVDRSIDKPAAFIETNLVGTFMLLESARHHWFEVEKRVPAHCRFHHISTDEVFGSLTSDMPAFKETTAYQPRSPYSATKAGSDHLVQAYYHTYGLPITISNCSNNYGPYQHPEKFIPTIVNACLKQQPIPLYGHGKNIRDWLYVEDHCRGIMMIMQNGKIGESYNLGGHCEKENLAVAEYICKEMDKRYPQHAPHKTLITHVTDRAGHDFRYAIDTSKIEAELGWKPLESFETGIQKTIAFYE